MRIRKVGRFVVFALVVGGLAAVAATPETASAKTVTPQHLHFEYGPVHLNPGQNVIQYSSPNIPKPSVAGWITGIKANMVLPDGSVPPSDVIMLHHAVWLNLSASDMTAAVPERFFATGEEKSYLTLPKGFGYHYQPSDVWLLNYMLHVLVNQSFDVRLTYDLEFVPEGTGHLRSVRPLWMDVQNGSGYPVFDAVAHTGVAGQYTYPAMAANPYGAGPKLNQYTVPVAGVIVQATGHLHSGGVSTELSLTHNRPRGGPKTGRIFKSDAVYWDPGGPVSWDMSMTATPSTWKVHVSAGDVLSLQATYDTSSRSWYESMGIMLAWFAPGGGGRGPFSVKTDVPGVVTHGHLSPENDNHGGGFDPDLPDPAGLPTGAAATTVDITSFEYGNTDLDNLAQVPAVPYGGHITFKNLDAPASGFGIFHTITGCKLPCNKTTGLAFPLPDSPAVFDSGQLGNDGPPTKGSLSWSTPSNLSLGTYTFYCRIHPFMRGTFRVTPS